MRFDKMTVKAQEAVQRAQRLAEERKNPALEPAHLLAALLAEESGGIVVPLLEKAGANVANLRRIVEGELKSLPEVTGHEDLRLSVAANEILRAA